MIKVKRALVSVSEKKGLIPFAKGLVTLGIEILSTGGTARYLQEAGIKVREVSDYTGFPEMLDGRVKTLNPKIHGGLLAVRENPEHMEQVSKHGIGLIDLVVVNLYPFESVTKKKNVSLEEAIENIDIGGPAMLRSAAKNFKNVAVICNPDRYPEILQELTNNSGLLSDAVLYQLAVEAFQHTSRYDGMINAFLSRRLQGNEFSKFPKDLMFKFTKIQDLRYGENPHQQAAFYRDADEAANGLASLKQRHGKELSFNNILDLNAAVDCIRELNNPAAVIVKHNNPTGIAENTNIAQAFRQAWVCDKISAFGGIIGLNRKVDAKTAVLIEKSGFMECVIAPGYDQQAFDILSKKKNLRLIELDWESIRSGGVDIKRVHGGLLVQERDEKAVTPTEWKVVSKKKPTKAQMDSFIFGWSVIKNSRSNAVLLVKGGRTVGVGCGQTSRVESVRVAIQKAGTAARGAVMVSDAFFPKIDNIQLAAKAGVKAVIQTGGSIADEDVIKTADKAGMTMVFTGVRHFKH